MYERPTSQSNFDDVGDFHEKFGLDNTTHHDIGPRTQLEGKDLRNLIKFRIVFLLEETLEFMEACGVELDWDMDKECYQLRIPEEIKIDHAKAFDALIDLVYVAMGTAHFLGYPWQMGWRLVQKANMAKVRASGASDSKRGSALDVIKPEGWTPPNIERLLSRIGF